MLNVMGRFIKQYQGFFLGVAIFLSLSAVSIISTGGQTRLILEDYPNLIFLLVVVSILFVLIYIYVDKSKIKSLSSQIKEMADEENEDFISLLKNLTSRQREVYDLIIEGKSNKEISSELFIEQSTLKSHINQIYKKLNIKSRTELKQKLT